VVTGIIRSADLYCGTINGDVTEPFTLNLDGSTFAAVRIPDGMSVEDVTPVLACPVNAPVDAGVADASAPADAAMADAPGAADAGTPDATTADAATADAATADATPPSADAQLSDATAPMD
jgi:hypothetical protein